ncbi:Uncharacterized conserved protein, DUF58 family, contains vWF domain [Actinomyces denticolens]|uniref:Uncharacterized conserved protein, DUF58 family, contains vWF domain n=1 Tax=Actinomyces denticolens TaxID=52767 RepID=A0ABY1HYV9_9ACTO|nr:DUF58 domain-containing protein [Actinomyces denticolens]SHI29596.1 Uncharacterized conserved protein, DUF58 family, contains vWF domain [Actinomyces denticolens]
MFLARRTAVVLALGAILGLLWPRPATIVVVLAATALAVGADVLLAASPRDLRVQRSLAGAIMLGETATATLTVTNTGSRTAVARVRDAWAPSAGATGERSRMTIPAGQRRRTRTALTPTRRGDRRADLVTVRLLGPLGLAGRQASLLAPARLRVLPPFASRRHLPSKLARLRELDGRSAVMVRGAGTEFDSLRQYVAGDDVRSIDWRSTARRGEVVVRTWRPERDRRILIILDTGRRAAARLGDMPRLDAQMEAALLLAALASRAGDRVDALAVDNAVRAQVRGAHGAALMSSLADALAPLDASLVETDWSLLASTVRQLLSHRSLVVILTGIDGAADADMLRATAALARDHALLIASATDPGLAELRAERGDTASVYTAAAAEKDLVEQHAVRARLARAGADVVQADPGGLASALADAYLALKASGRL